MTKQLSRHSCKICASDNREEIDELLKQKMTYREIAKRFINSIDGSLHSVEQCIGRHHKNHKQRELTDEDRQFLTRMSSGEVTLDEASRVVAAKAFENLLRNPSDARLVDFFRAELLKQKQQENRIRDTWGKEIIARLFAGKLPPKYCPHCGKLLVEGTLKPEMIEVEDGSPQELRV